MVEFEARHEESANNTKIVAAWAVQGFRRGRLRPGRGCPNHATCPSVIVSTATSAPAQSFLFVVAASGAEFIPSLSARKRRILSGSKARPSLSNTYRSITKGPAFAWVKTEGRGRPAARQSRATAVPAMRSRIPEVAGAPAFMTAHRATARPLCYPLPARHHEVHRIPAHFVRQQPLVAMPQQDQVRAPPRFDRPAVAQA